jgi:ferritin-like metal-binding protein YciE
MARIRPMLQKVQRQINWEELQKQLQDAQRKMKEQVEQLQRELSGSCTEI